MPPIYVEGTNEISTKVYFQETQPSYPSTPQIQYGPIAPKVYVQETQPSYLSTSQIQYGPIAPEVYVQETQPSYPPTPQIQYGPIPPICSHYPQPGTCPYCRQPIVTKIKRKNGLVVWLASAGICFLGFALGCCLIPFFIDGFKDTVHYCPICNRMIGRKKRF